MKRYGDLYQKICEYDNIKMAHEKAKRDKSHYSAVKRVNASLNEYLWVVQHLLLCKEYRVSKYNYQKIIDKEDQKTLQRK